MLYSEALNPDGANLFHIGSNAEGKLLYQSVRFAEGTALSDDDVHSFLQKKGTIVRKGKPGKQVKAQYYLLRHKSKVYLDIRDQVRSKLFQKCTLSMTSSFLTQ